MDVVVVFCLFLDRNKHERVAPFPASISASLIPIQAHHQSFRTSTNTDDVEIILDELLTCLAS